MTDGSNHHSSRYGASRNPLSDLRPLEVTVFDDNLEKAIRVLKREMGKEGVLRTLKQKRYYEKPSEAKKRKQREAVRRQRRSVRRQTQR
jgi:small subunit ribosomal protein S21